MSTCRKWSLDVISLIDQIWSGCLRKKDDVNWNLLHNKYLIHVVSVNNVNKNRQTLWKKNHLKKITIQEFWKLKNYYNKIQENAISLFIANILEKNILKLGKFDYDNHPSMQNIESYQ